MTEPELLQAQRHFYKFKDIQNDDTLKRKELLDEVEKLRGVIISRNKLKAKYTISKI